MSACPETWNAERTALAAESLHRSGALRLQVRGLSMLPSLWPGDEVEIVRCPPADLKLGDVVLGIRSGNFILHRLLELSPNGEAVIRGDAMSRPDPAVPADAILGRAVRVRRGRQASVLLPRRVPFQRALGLLLCHVGFARRIALRVHNWRSHEKKEELQIVEAASLEAELGSTR